MTYKQKMGLFFSNHSLYSFPAFMSSQAHPPVCNYNLDINFWDKLVYPYLYLSIKSGVKSLPSPSLGSGQWLRAEQDEMRLVCWSGLNAPRIQ